MAQTKGMELAPIKTMKYLESERVWFNVIVNTLYVISKKMPLAPKQINNSHMHACTHERL